MAVAPVTVPLKADSSQLKAALDQGATLMRQFSREIKQMQASQKELAATMDQLKSGVGAIGDAFALGLGEVVALTAALVAFGSAAIDAANLMDPSGAEQWYQSVLKLKDAWVTFAGTIGKEVRPVVEWLMAKLVELMHFLERVDFAKWAHDAAFAFNELKEMAADFWKVFKGGAEGLANLILGPFDAILKGITEFIALAMEQLAKVQDMAKAAGHGEGGDATRDMASKIRTVGGAGIVKIAGTVLNEAGKEVASMLDGQLKMLQQEYVKPAPKGGQKDKHFADVSEIEARNAADSKGLREQMRAAALKNTEAQSTYEKAKESADYDLQKAKEKFALSGKSYFDQMALLKTQSAVADNMIKAGEKLNAANHAAVVDAKSKFDVEGNRGQNDKDKDLDRSPAGHDPKAIAEAQGRMKLFQQEESFQKTLEQRELQSDGKLHSLRMKYIEDESAKREADAQRLQRIQDTASGVGKSALGPAGGAIDIGKALMGAGGDPVEAIIKFVAEMLMASSAFKMLQDAVAPLVQLIADLMGVVMILQGVMLPVILILDVLGPSLKVFSDAIQLAIDLVAAPFKALGAIIGSFYASVLAPFQTLAQMVTLVGQTIGAVINNLNPLVMLAQAFAPVVDALKSLLGSIGTSPFADGLKQLGTVLSYITLSVQRALVVFDPVKEIFNRLVLVFDQVFGPSIAKLGNGMVEIAGILNSALLPILNALGPFLNEMASGIGKVFYDQLGFLYDALRYAAIGMLQIAIWLATGWNTPMQLMSSALQFVATSIIGVSGTFIAMFDNVIQTIAGFVSQLRNALGGNNGPFAGPLKSLFDSITGMWMDPTQGGAVSSALKSVAGSLSSLTINTDSMTAAQTALQNATWDSVSSQMALAGSAGDLNQQLTNMPTAFSVARAWMQAAAAGAGTGGGSTGGNGFGVALNSTVASNLFGSMNTNPNDAHTTDGGNSSSNRSDRAFRRNRSGSGTSGGGSVTIQGNLVIQIQDATSLDELWSNLSSAVRNSNLQNGLGLSQNPVNRLNRLSTQTPG
jgi:hypothetical protein